MLATEHEFEDMINDALDQIPERFARSMKNLAITWRDADPDDPTLLGLFVGVPLPKKHANPTGFLPDTIFIYRDAIEAICHTREQLQHQVKVTVFHEVGHYFGFDDDELHELGWG